MINSIIDNDGLQLFLINCSLINDIREINKIDKQNIVMKFKRQIVVLIFILDSLLVIPQAVVITDDGSYTTGHASSMLDVKSISKGILFPRLTQSDRNSIGSPATGLLIFQTDNTPGFYYFTGSGWVMVGPTVDGSETKVSAGTNVTVTGSGTTGSPYVINSTSADGSETKIDAGTNISVTGSGTSASHYIISATAADGSETKIDAGANVTVAGSGTSASHYVINATGGDGSETKIDAGTNVTITGTGTSANHYIINSTGGDGSETIINAGTSISVTGSGTTGTPYIVNYRTQSVTITERNDISSPATGRFVWCNNCGTSGEMQIYNGSSWVNMSGGASLPALPTITTVTQTNVKSTTANSGGSSISAGGGTITAKGICWNTSTNPTISNNYTNDGTGTSDFESDITKLSPSTTYYVRAYATNAAGTSYGSNISFTTTVYTVGDPCQGGIIAYLNGTGGGVIAQIADLSAGKIWGCSGSTLGASGTAVFTGELNTITIKNLCGTTDIAARACWDLTDGGFSDWHLPSKDELGYLYTNRVAIGGFDTGAGTSYYWSSSEHFSNTSSYAWSHYFNTNSAGSRAKTSTARVRAVRDLIAVGQPYGGGKVAYILQPGDPGYIAGEIHGFVVTTSDVSTGTTWGCGGTLISGADGSALGTGNQNTIDIMAGCAEVGKAARICGELVLNGYADWYLPSTDELYKIYINSAAIGSFGNIYWTSTESTKDLANTLNFLTGVPSTGSKGASSCRVRAIRAF